MNKDRIGELAQELLRETEHEGYISICDDLLFGRERVFVNIPCADAAFFEDFETLLRVEMDQQIFVAYGYNGENDVVFWTPGSVGSGFDEKFIKLEPKELTHREKLFGLEK